MKIRRLCMEGVGSFAQQVSVDFEGLTSAGLFLIEGPTGSGKSTILDAIVYALYGSVAGAASDLGRLDSHMRSGSPWVELEFEVSGTTYLVRRSPGHERAKKRGDGTTSVNATASLMMLSPDGPQELATRASDVADHVQEIIGLNKQQFVSTVVLAQGEFANFLDAGTGERTQILEKIFGTEFYKRVEEQLQAMRKHARKRRDEADDAVADMVEQCKGVLEVELDQAEPLCAVDAALMDLTAQVDEARAAADRAGVAMVAAQEDLRAAKTMAADQERKRRALARRAELEAVRSKTQSWRADLEAHRRAIPLVPAIEAWRTAVVEAASARSGLQDCAVRLQDLGEAPTPDPERLDALVGVLGGLGASLQAEAALPALRTDLEQAHAQAQQAQETLRRAQEALVDLETCITCGMQEVEGLPDVSDQVVDLSTRVEVLQRRHEAWGQWCDVERQHAAAVKRAAAAQESWQAADAAARAASQARLRDHAAQLAAGLVDGQPCAVCGSVSHPVPARPDDGAALEDLAALQERAQERQAQAMRLHGEATRFGGLMERLAAEAGPDADEVPGQLAAAQSALADAQSRQRRRQQVAADLQTLVGQRPDATEAVTEARLSEQRCAALVQAAGQALASSERIVEQGRSDHPSVAVRVAHLESVRDAHRVALDALRLEERRREELRRSVEVLDDTLERAGFSDVAAAQAGLLDPNRVEELDRDVKAWDDDLADVERTLRDLADVDIDNTLDLEAISERCVAAIAHARQAASLASALQDRLARARPRRDQLQVRLERASQVRADTEPVIRMADLATAQRHEVIHRVKLSSFVLMRRFEDVVRAANDRLDAISEGRYQLAVEGQGLDARTQAGLDLRIYDGRSDSKRSTRSLSGGERFYVSLALALGLADVVRAESGGVELGTLFIDEGFGSLDLEVLEEVMDMLEQVRVGEDRVIGLISHVDLLKSRI
ncbi:MAG: SMC family ATPase, partial [Candidatus Nanopelagicales bacterium]